MQIVKDNKGEEWKLELNLHTARIIEAADFSEVFDGKIKLLDRRELDLKIFMESMASTEVVFTVAWCMVADDADQRGITDLEFSRRLGGKELYNLKVAVWEEVTDFFPEHRTSLLKIQEALKGATEKINKRMEQASDELVGKMDSLLDSYLEQVDQDLSKT